MEQRTDETARRPGVAAEDAGVPPAEDGQTETMPSASEDAADANGHTREEEAVWKPAGRPAADAAPDRGPGRPLSTADGSFRAPADDGSQPTTAEGTYQSSGTDHGYPADGAYAAGRMADNDYRPAGTDPEHPAPTQDFPSVSVAGQDYGASPSESIYGSSGAQREFSDPPYPAQVTPPPRPQSDPGPQPEADQAQRPSPWQAGAARMPIPQAVPKRTKAPRAEKGGGPGRQAHLMVSRFEPWSVMKFSFMISLACFVILFVAVTLLYGTLAGLGVFDSIQKALSNVTSGQGTAGVSVSHWFSASTILSYTALLGVLNVFLITAFATVGSVVYNLTAHLVGGVEVTLRETELRLRPASSPRRRSCGNLSRRAWVPATYLGL